MWKINSCFITDYVDWWEICKLFVICVNNIGIVSESCGNYINNKKHFYGVLVWSSSQKKTHLFTA